jgi:hypothetical protein
VGAEQNECLVTVGGIELAKSVADGLGHGVDEAGVYRPTIDDAPLKGVAQAGSTGGPPQLIQTGAGGAAGKLRVLGERYRALHPIGMHRPQGVVAARLGIAERYVELVGSGCG